MPSETKRCSPKESGSSRVSPVQTLANGWPTLPRPSDPYKPNRATEVRAPRVTRSGLAHLHRAPGCGGAFGGNGQSLGAGFAAQQEEATHHLLGGAVRAGLADGVQPTSRAFCGNMALRVSSSTSVLKAWRVLSASARWAAGRALISSNRRFTLGSFSHASAPPMM